MKDQILAAEMGNGVTVIGSFISKKQGVYVFKNLLAVHFCPNQDGRMAISMSPYPLIGEFGSRYHLIQRTLLIDPYTPTDDIIKAYENNIKEIRQRLSGIEVVPTIPAGIVKPN